MRVLVAFDARLERTPDGRVWWDGSLEYSFWQRYLEVFDQVRVVARVRDVAEVVPHARQLDGPRVTVTPVPFFTGPWQFALRQAAVRRAIRAELRPDDAAILRVPATVGTCLHDVLVAAGHPYAVEVVGDPYDMFAPGSVRSIVRPVMRWWFPRRLRRQCANACAAAYVTSEFLQRRYPPGPDTYALGVSDIDLRDVGYVTEPRPARPRTSRLKLVYVGSLAQLYKAPDVLIKAVAANVARGLDLALTMIGDGQYRPELEQLVRRCLIGERVQFLGRIPAGRPVIEQLDRADVFVLPSHQEGLPRAMVEAMARGLPCIGSTVGGIPELLAPEDMVPPGNVEALAVKIREVHDDAARLAAMSARNLQRAGDFHADILWERRRGFYEAVRDRTVAWARQAKQV